jgi:SAM-dependent methyltransferase
MATSPSSTEAPAGGEGPSELDWDGLAQGLSASTLAALRSHMAASTVDARRNQDDQGGLQNNSGALNHVYKDKAYWDERFKDEQSYDWLLNFQQIKDHLLPLIKTLESKILVIGCGNSSFSADLYDAGYENIVNIDFSVVVIDSMRAKYKDTHPNMDWCYMDMTDLNAIPNESYDVVLDKAAMDAIMVDEGDVWNPKLDIIGLVDKMCAGISRVLVQGGVHLQISFAQPHFRTKYLSGTHVKGNVLEPYKPDAGYCERYKWELMYQTVECGGCLPYFFYIMFKR